MKASTQRSLYRNLRAAIGLQLHPIKDHARGKAADNRAHRQKDDPAIQRVLTSPGHGDKVWRAVDMPRGNQIFKETPGCGLSRPTRPNHCR